jgi:cadmium resistance transport/sequestration family protein
MLSTIATATVLYAATAIDLLVILMIFFGQAKTRKQYRQIFVGQYIGSLTLIAISLILAYILNFVPEEWMLGFLGLIPLYLGIKVALVGDDDEEAVEKQLNERGLGKLTTTVALITIASCGSDNIGLFVPYFVSITVPELLTTLITFVVLIFVLVFIAQKLTDIPGVGEVTETFGRWIMASIYIGLGVYILVINGTLGSLLSFLSS